MVKPLPALSRRRRVIRRIALGCLAGVTCGAALYALLPWLCPTGALARRVEDQLSALMQRTVTIERLTVGYRCGVVVDGLRMARRPGFGDGPLLTAERITLPVENRLRLSYDLLALLWRGRSAPVARLAVDGLACWIVIGDDGTLNIGDLNDRGGGTLPALAYEVADLELNLLDRRNGRQAPTCLQWPAFYCRLDPASGRMTWSGAGASAAGETVNLAGDVLVPRLQRAVALAGGGELAWTDVRLADLPAALWPTGLALREGTSTGRLRIDATRELDVRFDLDLTLGDVVVETRAGRSAPIDRVDIGLAGVWSAAGRALQIDALRCAAGDEWVIDGSEPGPPIRVDDRPLTARLRLSGRARRSERVLAWLAGGGVDLRGWSLRGPAGARLDVRLADGAWTGRIELSGDGAELLEHDTVVATAGTTKRATVDLEGGGARRVTARLGASEVDLHGHLHAAARWADLTRGRIVLDAAHSQELARRLGTPATFAGPVRVVVEGVRHERGLEIMTRADLEPEARVSWPPWFDKRIDEAVHVRAAWLWPGGDTTTFDGLDIELSTGAARLALSDARLEVGHHGAATVRAVRGPFVAADVASLLRLLPAVDRARGAVALSGDCHGRVEVNLAGDGTALRVHADIDAAGLDVLGETFDKRRAAPAGLRVDYRVVPAGRSLSWSADLAGGTLAGSSQWTEEDGPATTALTAEVTALSPWLAQWSTGRGLDALLGLTGAARVSWHSRPVSDAVVFTFDSDLSATGFCLEDGGLCKPAGPALALRGSGRWTVHDGGARIALDASEISTADSRLTWQGIVEATRTPEGPRVDAVGDGRFDWAVTDGLRGLADHRGWGGLTWAGRAAGTFVLRGPVDADRASWVVDGTDLAVGTRAFRKAAGVEAALAGSAGADGLTADLHVAGLTWRGPDGLPVEAVDELVGRYSGTAAAWTFDLRGAAGGGLLTGAVGGGTGRLPTYELSGAAPSPATLRLCRGAFPGLQPDGPLTWRTGPPHDNDPGEVVARGELIVAGGVLSGKAAPTWMTTVFPRLNLARFTFERMHDWFVVHEDGRIQHQAIFQGGYYHLYVTGWQQAPGGVDYVIGIDLLAGQESPYWVEVGGGRIPLFRSVMRADADGNVLEESVHYVPLRVVKALLWESNPLYTAYHALRKRALGRE